jgi:hypothetical protein
VSAPALDPQSAARAELAAAAAGRRGATPIDPADLIEILGTWEQVTRRLREPLDPMSWLAAKDDLHTTALEHLTALRETLLRPGSAPWPTHAEVRQALAVARHLRARLSLA